jgi:alkanesulfonate monooxygenase SsuD/methylene tetrahydromethanopterin reductase-like flavin-dependent oxidoreductase (luciferase family)
MLNHVTCDPFKGDFSTLKKGVLEAESLGYRGGWTNDFLTGLTYPLQSPKVVRTAEISKQPWFESWTMITSLAAVTERFRVGTLVLANPMRQPVLVAKMSATLDAISNGRLDFGIGAGLESLMKIADSKFGMPFIGSLERLKRLREAIEVVKRIWTCDEASYEGQFYRINGFVCIPKPVQKPHPPVWIGGQGEAIMKIAADLADGYNGAVFHTDPDRTKRIFDRFNQFCKTAGRDMRKIRRAWQGVVLIGKNDDEVREKIRNNLQAPPRPEIYNSIEEFIRPRIVGTPQECVEQVRRYLEAGVTDFILYFPDAAQIRSLQLFAEKVMPSI